MQAVNTVGASILSDEIVVPATVPPAAVQDLIVTESGDGSVSLAWSAPKETGGTALSGYFFYYQTHEALALDSETWLKSDKV